jgi:plastocyanin
MRRWIGLVALATVVVLVGAACSKKSPSGGSSESEGGQITIAGDKANDHGRKSVSGMTSFELEADNDGTQYYFNPTTLNGKAGQKLTIEVKNEGNTAHNFSIDSQKINSNIDPGKTVDVTVTFPTSGVLEFYCAFHRSLGMVGQLKVG